MRNRMPAACSRDLTHCVRVQQMKLYEQYKRDLKEAQQEHERDLQRSTVRVEAGRDEVQLARSETERVRESLTAANLRIQALEADGKELRQACKAALSRERSAQVRALRLCACCWPARRLTVARAQLDLEEKQLEVERERRTCQVHVEEVAADAQARLAEYKDRKVAEMEQIHEKLQAVLGKKNATISQLRASLEQAHLRLAAHEKDVRRQKLELLRSMESY